jgi:hypothetical protein
VVLVDVEQRELATYLDERLADLHRLRRATLIVCRALPPSA